LDKISLYFFYLVIRKVITHTYFALFSHSSEQYFSSGPLTNLPHCEHVEYIHYSAI